MFPKNKSSGVRSGDLEDHSIGLPLLIDLPLKRLFRKCVNLRRKWGR